MAAAGAAPRKTARGSGDDAAPCVRGGRDDRLGIVVGTGLADPRVVVADARGEPSGVAEVRCEGEDTFVSTPTVLAQANGVRIRAENGGGGEIWLEYELDGGSNGGGAELLGPGTSEVFVRAPEQTLGLACTEQGDGTASDHATRTVVGPLSTSRG